MAQIKTIATTKNVESFIATVTDETVRQDCHTLVAIMKKITGEPAVMWGHAIIGFGRYHYKYESGREGDMCRIGFSPRKANLTLYVLSGFAGQDELLKQPGKHKTGKGCLYIKKLTDIDQDI